LVAVRSKRTLWGLRLASVPAIVAKSFLQGVCVCVCVCKCVTVADRLKQTFSEIRRSTGGHRQLIPPTRSVLSPFVTEGVMRACVCVCACLAQKKKHTRITNDTGNCLDSCSLAHATQSTGDHERGSTGRIVYNPTHTHTHTHIRIQASPMG
jgi:hypothetical protein